MIHGLERKASNGRPGLADGDETATISRSEVINRVSTSL